MHAAAHSGAIGLCLIFVRVVDNEHISAHTRDAAAHASTAVGTAIVHDLELVCSFLVCARVAGLCRGLFACKENKRKQFTETRAVDNALYVRVHSPRKITGV